MCSLELSNESMTYREAIRTALRRELKEDPSVVLLGEDIAAHGGVFKCTDGLADEFGNDRIVDTPISEQGFAGIALGMALVGMRPVVEIMFADFLAVAASPIGLDIPRWRLMSGGQMSVPLTIRTVGGLGGHFGAQHSMTYESWFQGLPGLKIATVSRPSSAIRILRAAVQHDNPVLVVEHKMLYARREPVHLEAPGNDVIGRAEIVRAGTDVTIVASLANVWRAIEGAELLAQRGIDAEVIDIAWIKPLDIETVKASVQKTRCLLVLSEEYFAGSWASTLLAQLAIAGVRYDTAPRAIHLPDDLPVPFAPSVEMEMPPSVDDVVKSAEAMIEASRR
ncbi:MAG: alpha-ketoacid dehydrogenase subunit beta [Alcaligenaceae bacterium]|nr:MAG: alpha-ketoacid dehydrogenase subunit beta [Alcaligenaceae bacterium]